MFFLNGHRMGFSLEVNARECHVTDNSFRANDGKHTVAIYNGSSQ